MIPVQQRVLCAIKISAQEQELIIVASCDNLLYLIPQNQPVQPSSGSIHIHKNKFSNTVIIFNNQPGTGSSTEEERGTEKEDNCPPTNTVAASMAKELLPHPLPSPVRLIVLSAVGLLKKGYSVFCC